MIKHLIHLSDWSRTELEQCFKTAQHLKKLQRQGRFPKLLENKSYALILHHDSLRTRVSFETGIFQLGGHPMLIKQSDFVMGKRESIPDVARALSRLVDGILLRTYHHADLE